MIWPFRRRYDALLRDTAVLDAQLADPATRASVTAFIVRLEVECREVTPENLIELGLKNGLDRDGAMLLCALAARLDGAK